ncbi:hypothetical protein JD969_13605 [Planctomycetota bacterium]|nr:hypothetical protein JD969_13605 [Planctomycetota bacterium]
MLVITYFNQNFKPTAQQAAPTYLQQGEMLGYVSQGQRYLFISGATRGFTTTKGGNQHCPTWRAYSEQAPHSFACNQCKKQN